MNRSILIAFLCLTAGTRNSSASLTVSYNEQVTAFGDHFLANPSLEVGSGTGFISPQVSDTFIQVDLGGSGQIAGGTISGTIANLRREPPIRPINESYANQGIYAKLDVVVKLLWSADDDPASLFGAYDAGSVVASFTVDNGVPDIVGGSVQPGFGPSFSAALSASSLSGGDPTRGKFYLGFGGSGSTNEPNSLNSVVGDLSVTATVQPVPEPPVLVLVATAIPALAARAWRRRK